MLHSAVIGWKFVYNLVLGKTDLSVLFDNEVKLALVLLRVRRHV